MKRTIFLCLAALLLAALFAGCDVGAERAELLTGLYEATSCRENGEDAGLEGEYILLDNDGDGVIFFGGVEYDFEWELDGSSFTFTDEDGDEFDGRYFDGVIEGEYYGYEWVFSLEGLEDVLLPGFYQAIYCADDEAEYWCDEDRLELEADGDGYLVFEGEEFRLDWELDGDRFSFDADDADFEGTYYREGSVTVDGVDYDAPYIEGVLIGEYDYIYVLDAASVKPEISLGLYEAVSCTEGADSYLCDEDWILLGADGEGTFTFEGVDYAMEWTLEGSEFSFIDELDNGFEGYYFNGSIEGCYADTYDYIFEAAEDDAGLQRPVPTGDFEPVSGRIGGHRVSLLGAEHFEDSDGEEAVRFYYEFTNGGDGTISPSQCLWETAMQDGDELELTYADYEDYAPEDGNEYLGLRPGATIRCVSEFNYEPTGGAVVFLLQDWGQEETVEASFDPARLPGPPSDELEYTPEPNPTTTAAASGTIADGYFVIEDMELTTGWDGEELVRIYCSFTNQGDEAESFFWDVEDWAIQDGVALKDGYAAEDLDEDWNWFTDIEPGETILCAMVYELRSDNPVIFELHDYESLGEARVAKVFEID